MALIKEFKQYLIELQNEIEGINLNKMVIDETQLTKYINDMYSDQNALLLGLLPNFGNNNPRDADGLIWRGYTEFMIVEKTDYSTLTETELVDQYDRLYIIIDKIKDKIINDHTNDTCGFLRGLVPSGFQIVEIFNLAQCNGWTMTVSFDVL